MEDYERLFDMDDRARKLKLLARLGALTGKWVIGARPYKAPRSNRQNAYLWAVVIPSFQSFMRSHGHEHTPEEVYEFLLQRFAGKPVVDPNTGEVMATIGRRGSKMDTAQFAEWMTRCVEWMESAFGIVVPPPDILHGTSGSREKKKVDGGRGGRETERAE